MFSQKELKIDPKYFDIIGRSAFCVTIRSKNTGHYWHILNQDGNNYRSCTIYHRHDNHGSYHRHGHKSTLAKCIEDIKGHDQFQLHGRRKDWQELIIQEYLTNQR